MLADFSRNQISFLRYSKCIKVVQANTENVPTECRV